MTPFSGKLSEDSPNGTVVALMRVNASGGNGQVCLIMIGTNLPFAIKTILKMTTHR